MKFHIILLAIALIVSGSVNGQNYEYDAQSCFNENETVQKALYESLNETLMNPELLSSLNDVMDFQLTDAELANLRPLLQSDATDADLCNYTQSTYTQSKWDRIGETYHIYHYRANDIFFSVYIIIPKSIFDPDFVATANRFRIRNIQGFDAQTGFQTGSALIGMQSYPGLELPESSN